MSDASKQNPHNATIDQFRLAETALSPIIDDLNHLHRLATMGTLAAAVAHEINNLLTPVLAYAQFAREHPDDREIVEKALAKTIAGIEAAAHIAENILGFTASPGQEMGAAPVEGAVQSAIECLGSQPRKQGISIETRIQPGLTIRMSPIALQHVLMNLFLNACEAMPRGGTLTVTGEEDADGQVRITVADTGPGVDREIAGQLFQPFVTSRGDGTRRSGERGGRTGRGLGLTICQHLMENAGGSIELAEGNLGAGAVFRILAPIYRKKRSKAG